MNYSPEIKSLPVTRCSFSYPGTYGHECGKRPVSVAVLTPSESGHWENEVFYAGRCAECAAEKGGENTRVIRFEPMNPSIHINRLICHRWTA